MAIKNNMTFKNQWIYPLLLVIFYVMTGWLVQYLPAKPQNTHIKQACEIYEDEGMQPGISGRIVDNYTDAVMLLIAQSTLEKAGFKRFLNAPLLTISKRTVDWSDIYPLQSLCDAESPKKTIYYGRYWHGYQIILKPLLVFFDFEQIRTLNMYGAGVCFVLMLWLMWGFRAYGLILGWILVYIILNPLAMGANLTYSIVFYIGTIASLLILCLKDKIEKRISFRIFFLMIGITTSFFDFLTYPIFTLGIPLTMLFYVSAPKNTDEMMKKIFTYVFYWGCGYVGMWVLKWILCALLTDFNIFEDAFVAFATRMNIVDESEKIPFYGALYVTFRELWYHFDTRLALIVGMLATSLCPLIYAKKAIRYIKQEYFKILPFLMIALGSPLYCLTVRGHPLQHYPYTYRLWSVFFFALISGFCFLFCALKNEARND